MPSGSTTFLLRVNSGNLVNQFFPTRPVGEVWHAQNAEDAAYADYS